MGTLAGDTRAGVMSGCSEGSSCRTSRPEEADKGGTELEMVGLPTEGDLPSPDWRHKSISERAEDERDAGVDGGRVAVTSKCGGAEGARSELPLSDDRFLANQVALSRSASLRPFTSMQLEGEGTLPRRSSASRSC